MLKKLFALSCCAAMGFATPILPVSAQTGGGSLQQCLDGAKDYADSVAEPNTSQWDTAFGYYIEVVCPEIIGGGGGGGADLVDLCASYPCNVGPPSRIPKKPEQPELPSQ